MNYLQQFSPRIIKIKHVKGYRNEKNVIIMNDNAMQLQLGMATRWGGNEFHYPIPISVKQFILIPIPKSNGYSSFISPSSPPGNEYNLVPIFIPVSLLLQYKF